MKGRNFTASDLQERLRSNKSLSEANPTIRTALTTLNAASGSLASASEASKWLTGAKTPSKGKKRGEMNRTEMEFSKFLEHKRLEGEIFSWEYEAITLRFAGMNYTPDFFVIKDVYNVSDIENLEYPMLRITFYETKGAHKWKADIVKFKAARGHFKQFRFELWQKKDREWSQLI